MVNHRGNEECFLRFALIYVKASLMVAIVTGFVARNDILLTRSHPLASGLKASIVLSLCDLFHSCKIRNEVVVKGRSDLCLIRFTDYVVASNH